MKKMRFALILCAAAVLLTSCPEPKPESSLYEMMGIEPEITLDAGAEVENPDGLSSEAPLSVEDGLYVLRILYGSQRSSRGEVSSSLFDISEGCEIWVMPTRHGSTDPIDPCVIREIDKFYPDAQGSFTIPKAELPNDSRFVVFVIHPSETGTPEFLGFLTLADGDDTQIIEFPPATELEEVISFGYTAFDGEDLRSSSQRSLGENEGSFSTDAFKELSEDVILHNAALMAVNVLMNSHEVSPEVMEYYRPNIGVGYRYDEAATVESSDDIEWMDLGIAIYSHDTASTAGLFRPDGVQVGSYITSYGTNSSVKWAFTISREEFEQYAQPRELWRLKTTDNVVLAEFDLSVMMPLDDRGNPIIPLMSMSVDPKTEDPSLIDSVDFDWFYFSPDGTTKNRLTDADQLDRLLDGDDFWFQKSGVTYMLGRNYTAEQPGAGGMEGDLTRIDSFAPDFPVSAFFQNFGYHFSLYNIEVIH